MMSAVPQKKKARKNIEKAVATITATFNNTIITITTEKGDTLAWSSSGACGFKGSKKSTPFAAQVAAEQVAVKAKEHGVRTCSVRVSGPGSGRETAIRALMSSGIVLTAIRDVTRLPHNGCKPPKRRRV